MSLERFEERFQRATGISLDPPREDLDVQHLQAELSTTRNLLVRYFRVVEIVTEGKSVAKVIKRISENATLSDGWEQSAAEIISLMDLPCCDVEGARLGCRALSRIARCGATDQLVRLGAVKSIVDAMNRHSSHAGIARSVCSTLRSVGQLRSARPNLIDARVIKNITAAMRRFPRDAKVARFGCSAVSVIFGRGSRRANTRSLSNGFSAIVEAMGSHAATHLDVARNGCRALRIFKYDQTTPSGAASKAVEVAVAALRAHPTSLDLAQGVARTMMCIATSPINRRAVGDSGVIQLLRDAAAADGNNSVVTASADRLAAAIYGDRN